MGRIVVGIDGSASSKAALRWAVTEAQCRHDALEAILAWENPYRDMWLPSNPAATDPAAHLRGSLARTVAAALGEDTAVAVTTRVVEGHPAQVLIDAAEGADLLVLGSRGRGGLASAMLGSVSLHCVSHAPCPVVVVRAPPRPGERR